MPFFAPASIAILHTVNLSSMERFFTPSPANSIDLYKAPSTPIRPIICSIRSLPDTHFEGFPESTNFMADGTFSQHFPVAITAARSVLPTPVENAPSAP